MTAKNLFYVYRIDRPDGTPCYIGKGMGKRRLKHAWRSTNPHLANIYRRAGGVLPISLLAENLNEAEAFALEIDLIAAIGREPHGPLVNMTNGGEGISGHVHSPLSLERMRAAATGQSRTKGKPKTPEHRAALSAAAKKRPKRSAESIEAQSSKLRGRKRPPEVGAKVSASKTGKSPRKYNWSPEARARQKDRFADPELRARISAGTKSGQAARAGVIGG